MKKETEDILNKYLREKINMLHVKENELNKKISNIDKTVKHLLLQKKKLAKQVSHNVLYRNTFINQL